MQKNLSANISNSKCCLVVRMGEIPGTRLYKQRGRAELASAGLSFHVRVPSGHSRGSSAEVCQDMGGLVRAIHLGFPSAFSNPA